jgi:transcription elongation factor Elf1
MSTKRAMKRKAQTNPRFMVEIRDAFFCRSCRHTTLVAYTAKPENGMIPKTIACEACGEEAFSYLRNLPPVLMLSEAVGGVDPTKEFYRPSEEEAEELGIEDAQLVLMGGLLLRDRTTIPALKRHSPYGSESKA